jgi:hypothetical protein
VRSTVGHLVLAAERTVQRRRLTARATDGVSTRRAAWRCPRSSGSYSRTTDGSGAADLYLDQDLPGQLAGEIALDTERVMPPPPSASERCGSSTRRPGCRRGSRSPRGVQRSAISSGTSSHRRASRCRAWHRGRSCRRRRSRSRVRRSAGCAESWSPWAARPRPFAAGSGYTVVVR